MITNADVTLLILVVLGLVKTVQVSLDVFIFLFCQNPAFQRNTNASGTGRVSWSKFKTTGRRHPRFRRWRWQRRLDRALKPSRENEPADTDVEPDEQPQPAWWRTMTDEQKRVYLDDELDIYFSES